RTASHLTCQILDCIRFPRPPRYLLLTPGFDDYVDMSSIIDRTLLIFLSYLSLRIPYIIFPIRFSPLAFNPCLFVRDVSYNYVTPSANLPLSERNISNKQAWIEREWRK